MAYIYIAWDITKPNLSKVGMTTVTPEKRISQTENPDYELYRSYLSDDSTVNVDEKEIHKALENKYIRRKHRATGKFSEWFECTPEDAREIVENILGYQYVKLEREVNHFKNENVKLQSRVMYLTQKLIKEESEIRFANDLIKKLQNDNEELKSYNQVNKYICLKGKYNDLNEVYKVLIHEFYLLKNNK